MSRVGSRCQLTEIGIWEIFEINRSSLKILIFLETTYIDLIYLSPFLPKRCGFQSILWRNNCWFAEYFEIWWHLVTFTPKTVSGHYWWCFQICIEVCLLLSCRWNNYFDRFQGLFYHLEMKTTFPDFFSSIPGKKAL